MVKTSKKKREIYNRIFLGYVCIKRTKYDETFLMRINLSKILNNKTLCLFNKIMQNILVYRYNSVIPPQDLS